MGKHHLPRLKGIYPVPRLFPPVDSILRSIGLGPGPWTALSPKFIILSSGLPVAIGRVQGSGIEQSGNWGPWMVISAAYTSYHLSSPVYIPDRILVWSTSSCFKCWQVQVPRLQSLPPAYVVQPRPRLCSPNRDSDQDRHTDCTAHCCQVTLVAMWDISCRR